jgi:hypothetical protein
MNYHPLRYYDTVDKPVDTVFADGYFVGDRLLEGVIFKFTWDDEQQKYIYAGPQDDYSNTYLKQINMVYWIPHLEKYVEEIDIVEDEHDNQVVRGAMIV